MTTRPPYEILDHTADVGLRVFGRSFADLFKHAAEGLYALATDYENLCQSAGEALPECHELMLSAEGGEELLLQWLKELLFLFSARGQVFVAFDFKALSTTGLSAVLKGVLFDPARHDSRCEIKAVTRHRFRVDQDPEGWKAEIIFDI